MKIFWSWQSDTPGKVGRHFVRGALAEAIEVLRQPNEIEEPSEREAREALHLDHDRQGVSGSPDLAPTIFRKIEQAAVFVADVTLVGETTPVGEKAEGRAAKKLINSNLAIEYGYAHHALGADASGPPRKFTRYSPGSRAMTMPRARSSAAASSKRERAAGASMLKA
jgi:hypothetical protein